MYRLYGYWTQNTMKTLYVLEELGVDFDFQFVDLDKGENKAESFLKLNPIGKLPVLQHDDDCLFESGAICRYLANVENSNLYPEDKLQRARVDQWMDYFSCHLGRWLNVLYFETILKVKAGFGKTDPKACESAMKLSKFQFGQVDQWLQNHKYFANDQLSIADLFAFAYIEQVRPLDYSIEVYPHVQRWYGDIESRASIRKARQRID